MFKESTLKKYTSTMAARISKYRELLRSGVKLALSFSAGNRKIGRVLNVSTAPLFTCRNCAECRWHCYDLKACLQYTGTAEARAKNTALLFHNRDEFFRQIDEKMNRRRKNLFFRYNVGGGTPDSDFIRRQAETAARHPEFTVWSYTKNYTAAAEYIDSIGGVENMPANFHPMLSEWKGLPLYNPHGLPVFACRMPGENIPEGCSWKCPGNCDICKAARRGCIVGENTYTDLH